MSWRGLVSPRQLPGEDCLLFRQLEYGKRAAECGVVAEGRVAADGSETFSRVGQACCQTDTGPAADTRKHGHVLLAVTGIGHHVADHPGRCLEAIELLAGRRVDRLQITLERSVEDH